MSTYHFQEAIFRLIKQHLPESQSMAETVSSILDISTDSAYRRIRNETQIELDEAQKLCRHFNLSLDNLMGLNEDKIIFSSNLINQEPFDFEAYMVALLRNMKYLHTFQEKKLYYVCKEIPVFFYFHSREIAAFKYYFWMKFLLQQPAFSNRKFSLEDYPDSLFNLGRQAYDLYNALPSVEFWNIESINSILRQIKFFYDTGCFTKRADVSLVYEKLLELIIYIEEISDRGYKRQVHQAAGSLPDAAFDMYHNEVILGSNFIIARLDHTQLTFINHSALDYAVTADLRFGEYSFKFIENLVKSSTRLSSNNAVERSAFFAELRKIIRHSMDSL